MTHRIPRTISDLKLRCLHILKDKKEGAVLGVIAAEYHDRHGADEYSRSYITKTVMNMATGGYVTKESEGAGSIAVYHISDFGEFVIKHADKIPRKNPVEGVNNIKNPPKVKPASPQTSMALAPEPEPIRVNISTTANSVVDHIADLVEENRRYRELMIKLHATLTKELGLDAPTINGEPLV